MAQTIGDTMDYIACCLDSSSPTVSPASSSSSVLSFNSPLNASHDDNNKQPSTFIFDENEKPSNKMKTKLPSSKYKGVVPQANGRWGAQLYNGHKRIWLGTFDTQEQAARAHDLAAIRFRGIQSAVNFSAHHYVSRPHHLEFLASHSMPQLVSMLQHHTYQEELARFLRARIAANQLKKRRLGQCRMSADDSSDPAERLFEKVLTASDVGKGTLHRLVIPKCHAERDLPPLKGRKGMMLTFEDGGGERVWSFKYCYWKGSKNYVLTKGWSHFVKEKGLKPGDVVAFYRSVGPDKRLYIKSMSSRLLPLVNGASQPSDDNGSSNSSDVSDCSGSGGSNMLRLFGVDI